MRISCGAGRAIGFRVVTALTRSCFSNMAATLARSCTGGAGVGFLRDPSAPCWPQRTGRLKSSSSSSCWSPRALCPPNSMAKSVSSLSCFSSSLRFLLSSRSRRMCRGTYRSSFVYTTGTEEASWFSFRGVSGSSFASSDKGTGASRGLATSNGLTLKGVAISPGAKSNSGRCAPESLSSSSPRYSCARAARSCFNLYFAISFSYSSPFSFKWFFMLIFLRPSLSKVYSSASIFNCSSLNTALRFATVKSVNSATTGWSRSSLIMPLSSITRDDITDTCLRACVRQINRHDSTIPATMPMEMPIGIKTLTRASNTNPIRARLMQHVVNNSIENS
mmetsp:Transcript_37254/g.64383  ORF Transcript_37254/g.64383 Transcript_37254/m.64383 type:complete len:334 (-) Transcript_37254:128-1129(-)